MIILQISSQNVILILICRIMDIQQEDTTSCLQCWGSRNGPPFLLYQTQINHPENQHNNSQRSVKLSLKKHKTSQKSSDSSRYRFSYQQCHQKRGQPFIRLQQKYPLHRPTSYHIQQRQKSHVTQNKGLRVAFNHNNHKGYDFNKEMVANFKTAQVKREGIILDQTTKLCELQETKKVIPGYRFSVEELYNMKQSVYSICEGEQKAKIQQSVIMMDFFNPNTSRLEKFNLKSKSKQGSSVFSQKR